MQVIFRANLVSARRVWGDVQDVLIIGGGLAGLAAALRLAREGLAVTLVEKKAYPFHRVCGEYISMEVVPFLRRMDAFPDELGPSYLTRLQVTSPGGRALDIGLDLGGFGISRYALDHWLWQKCVAVGVHFLLRKTVEDVRYQADIGGFEAVLADGSTLQARLAIGSFGKRSVLDRRLDRPFMRQSSPYIGVKYHLRTDMADDLIALHNFEDGYCGISRVENGVYNLCYLTTRAQLRRHGDIPAMEEAILWRNPHLRRIWHQSQFLWPKPEVINEISFAPKQPVEGQVLMVGDAAGLITPLCGNGMAMALHAAKLATDQILAHYPRPDYLRHITGQYARLWQQHFGTRLMAGRRLQQVFGSERVTDVVIALLQQAPTVTRWLMKQTHGQPF